MNSKKKVVEKFILLSFVVQIVMENFIGSMNTYYLPTLVKFLYVCIKTQLDWLLTYFLLAAIAWSQIFSNLLKGDPWLRGPSHTLNCPNSNSCAKSLIWASSVVVFLCLHCLFTFKRKRNNNKIGPPFDQLNTAKIQIGAIQCVNCPFQPGSTL